MRDALGDVQTILVLGGSSEIGVAIAARLAAPRRAEVVLAGRHRDRLEEAAAGLLAAGAARVSLVDFDATDTAGHRAALDGAVEAVGDLDVVVLAFGLLDGDPVEVASTNYVGGVSAGLAVAERLRLQGHGVLVVLSSVAGERVRRDNFVYGSTKAGLDGFAQGLGDSLAGSGGRVLVVRPGFVVGRMTAGLPRAPLATTPEAVAAGVESALRSGAETVWVPASLRPVFAVLRHLPRPLWRRLPVPGG